MSASPSGPSNSGTPAANGQKKKVFKKSTQGDPLRQGSKQNLRPPPQNHSLSRPNGIRPVARPNAPSRKIERGPLGLNGANPPRAQTEFSEIPTGPFQDFPLVTTKRALREGLRYHVARFSSKKAVDPTNQDEFTRPVTLHRRDSRQPLRGQFVKGEDPTTGLPLDEKDQEKLEKERLEREKRRAEDLAQIAPTGNNASALAAKKNASFRNEKTTQVHRLDKTEEQKKASDLRYEEALPWHLEDAENKHTWVGSYEAALSDTNVIFLIEDNCFKMIPVEKWYKFTPKNQFKTMTIEEAEAQMIQKSKPSRWVMHLNQPQQEAREREAMYRESRQFFAVKREAKKASKEEADDANDIDYDENELFQDDDEQVAPGEPDDEDTKLATEKIKRERQGANLFGLADENEVDKEFEEEAKKATERKILGKRTKKALKKREKNYLYDSDSSHPYSSSSEDDSSDEERRKKKEEEDKKKKKEEEDKKKKKEEEDKKKREEESKLKSKSASKIPSGASTKGTNTPSVRSKKADAQRIAKNLKRPGSPNLSASEASGNESSRKKFKNKHVLSSSQPPSVPARPMSPAPSSSAPAPGTLPRKTSVIKLNLNPSRLSEIQSVRPNPSGVMSDGEGTTGEMSDGAEGPKKKKKGIKLVIGSGASKSQPASRSGSPANLSRAGSPAVGQTQRSPPGFMPPVATKPSVNQSPGPVITAEEIMAILPVDGISIGDILKRFSRRIDSKNTRDKFIRMVKEHSAYNPEDKLLRPKV